jgi:hypothetical protein
LTQDFAILKIKFQEKEKEYVQAIRLWHGWNCL